LIQARLQSKALIAVAVLGSTSTHESALGAPETNGTWIRYPPSPCSPTVALHPSPFITLMSSNLREVPSGFACIVRNRTSEAHYGYDDIGQL
jgi:hypothetical protein